jgi:hypothetical protein
MSTLQLHVDVEEIETTKSEKLLAVVLAVFLLVGGVWAYLQVDDGIRAVVDPAVASPADVRTVTRLDAADAALFRTEERERRALATLTLDREAYRTALDAGRPASALARQYDRSQASFEEAQRAVAAARAAVAAVRPAAEDAQARISAEQQAVARTEELGSFGARLALVLAMLAFAFALLGRLRTRGSRYLPLGLAAVGYASVLAAVLAADYLTDYVDPLEFGPLVLAAVGTALTLLAFVALQRYLTRRLPHRRVRKDECPFCGFPARERAHCEGCGRGLVADCVSCAEPRRVGAAHCGACGSA